MTDLRPSSRTPAFVLLPVLKWDRVRGSLSRDCYLVKSVLRAPVPEYWMLIMSAWSAQTFLKRYSKCCWFSILTFSPRTPSLQYNEQRLTLWHTDCLTSPAQSEGWASLTYFEQRWSCPDSRYSLFWTIHSNDKGLNSFRKFNNFRPAWREQILL